MSVEVEEMAAEGAEHAASPNEVNLIHASGGSLPHLHRLTQWAQSVGAYNQEQQKVTVKTSWRLCACGKVTNEGSAAAVA